MPEQDRGQCGPDELFLSREQQVNVDPHISVPSALLELDGQFGTNTQYAYQVAVAKEPRLQAVLFELSSGRSCFSPAEAGLAASRLQVSRDRQFYLRGIRSGIARRRLSAYSSLYRSVGVVPQVNELVTAVTLHELGHAYDLLMHIDAATGDTKAAFSLSRSTRRVQLASLPLGAPTSHAQWAWDHNIDGYRDAMQGRGYTNERWQIMLAQNTQAYSELPCEQIPDRFALGVLATVCAR